MGSGKEREEFDEICVDQTQMGSEKERILHKLECRPAIIGNAYYAV